MPCWAPAPSKSQPLLPPQDSTIYSMSRAQPPLKHQTHNSMFHSMLIRLPVSAQCAPVSLLRHKCSKVQLVLLITCVILPYTIELSFTLLQEGRDNKACSVVVVCLQHNVLTCLPVRDSQAWRYMGIYVIAIAALENTSACDKVTHCLHLCTVALAHLLVK